MCTVTYLPLGGNDFILTSNRDENPARNTFVPQEYVEDGVRLTYPKDALAGGTWIGLSEKDRLICLLNGGFENHTRKESYKMSRGVIVKELLKVNDAVNAIELLDLEGVEPFTIVLVDWSNELAAYELVWTGTEKSFKELSETPHIWSSSTLYTEEMKQMRRNWFADWLNNQEQGQFNQDEVLNFHKDDSKEATVSLKMKRETVQTVSVTSFKKEADAMALQYHDLLNNSLTISSYQNSAKAEIPTSAIPMDAKNI